MNIQNDGKQFYVVDVSDPKAFLAYEYVDEHTVRAYHTVTKKEMQGQGMAGKLYDAFIDFVKKENLKVRPDCSYVKKKMEASEEDRPYLAE